MPSFENEASAAFGGSRIRSMRWLLGAGFRGPLPASSTSGSRSFGHGSTNRGLRSVGGTWYWNRYPGARCDIESMQYSYQFSEELQQEWEWSERYAAQPEILRYLEHVTERFDLARDVQFETRVKSAAYEESSSRWEIEYESAGETHRVSSKYFVMATGCLSSANTPEFPGLD